MPFGRWRGIALSLSAELYRIGSPASGEPPASLRAARVSRRSPCPICGHGDWCLAFSDRVLCMRVESSSPGRSGGWWHGVGEGKFRREEPLALPDSRERHLAPPDPLHRGLSALLAHSTLQLSQRHREALVQRGLTAAAIADGGYATLPRGHRAEAARDLALRSDARGVPGLYVNSNRHGDYRAVAGAPGLLIPVRDEQARIRGAQIRCDEAGSGGKYRWLSSGGKRGGTGSGSPPHWTLAGDRSGELWITEGALKADVAAHLSGHRFLAVAGVHSGQGRRVVEELQGVGWPDEQRLVLAFDADFASNPHVRKALVSIGHRLAEAGYTVEVATWGPALGKGIDDALLAGATVHRTPFARFSGEPEPRIRRTTETRKDTNTETRSEATSEAGLVGSAAVIADLTSTLLNTTPHAAHILEAGLGVGKTSTVADTLARRLRFGPWPTVNRQGHKMPVRVAFLVDTTAKAEEIALAFAHAEPGDAVLLRGRDAQNCRDFARVRLLGERRHSPEQDLCSSCPFAAECAYLAQRDAAREARVVIATKPALLTNGRDLSSFDLVVSDEDVLPSLYEVLELTASTCSAWLSAMGGVGECSGDHPDLVRVLRTALTSSGAAAARGRARALPLLTAAARSLGLDLCSIVGRLMRARRPKGGRYEFESPWSLDSQGRTQLRAEVPVRALRDLIELIADEIDGKDREDTRLWLESGEGGARLLAYRPNSDLIETLRSRCVLVLDATPDFATLVRVFPGLVRHSIEVPEQLHVTQFTNALRQSDGARLAVRERVLSETTGTVAVLTRKHIAEADETEQAERLQVGWWGRHHRAVNDFQGAEAVIVEDRFSPPVDEARAYVEMWRFGRPPDGDPATYVPYAGTEFEGRKPGAGEETDPDVAAWVSWRWGADVRQAIGRARACRQDRPVRVIIESRDPVPGLQVDRLVSAQEFLGWSLSEKRHDALVARNVAQREEAAERIARAIAEFESEHGRLPSQRELCEAARCSTHRAGPALAEHRRRTQAQEVAVSSSEGDADGLHKDSLGPSAGIGAGMTAGEPAIAALDERLAAPAFGAHSTEDPEAIEQVGACSERPERPLRAHPRSRRERHPRVRVGECAGDRRGKSVWVLRSGGEVCDVRGVGHPLGGGPGCLPAARTRILRPHFGIASGVMSPRTSELEAYGPQPHSEQHPNPRCDPRSLDVAAHRSGAEGAAVRGSPDVRVREEQRPDQPAADRAGHPPPGRERTRPGHGAVGVEHRASGEGLGGARPAGSSAEPRRGDGGARPDELQPEPGLRAPIGGDSNTVSAPDVCAGRGGGGGTPRIEGRPPMAGGGSSDCRSRGTPRIGDTRDRSRDRPRNSSTGCCWPFFGTRVGASCARHEPGRRGSFGAAEAGRVRSAARVSALQAGGAAWESGRLASVRHRRRLWSSGWLPPGTRGVRAA